MREAGIRTIQEERKAMRKQVSYQGKANSNSLRDAWRWRKGEEKEVKWGYDIEHIHKL